VSEVATGSGGGIGLGGALMILFVGLKLTGYVDWSWWWVLSPVWIPLGLALVCVILIRVLR
jgi:hypothetical protein